MNLSEIFIRRPVATTLLMLAMALFGLLAYRSLPVADLPNVDFPTLSVSASLPGANPETMASAVATPLERQFTGISGLDSMVSASSTGSTQITLQFHLSRQLDSATVDVQTAIAEALPLLPAGMPSPPSFRKSNPSDFPIMFLGLTTPTLPMWELNEYAETRIAQRLSMINGVAQVNIFGAQKFAVRVQADPTRLSAYQIGINEVQAALQNWNVNLPTGTLYGPDQAFNIKASGQLSNSAAYRPLIVAYRNGAPVRLEQVAHVIDSVEDDKTSSWFYSKQGGRMAINLMIMRQPNSNIIEVTDAVKKLLPEFQDQLPPAVQLQIRGDRSETIRESFHDVQLTLSIALGLVITVIFLFLRKGTATLIPGTALPFSIVGTFAVMYLLDYSLNNLSMMALILSVGFVVDDAIVMLENIVRHIERGESPLQAAYSGSKEIGFTIVSMTLSLAAVFIPVLFMGGILGRLFREFAVTICAAILISGVVSLSLTPLLCSRFLRPRSEQQSRFFRITELFFNGMLHGYDLSLRWVLRHRFAMICVFFLTIAATGWLFVKVPKGFIPEQDTGQMFVSTEATQGTSYHQMAKYQQDVADILRADPGIETFMSSIGGPFNTGGNTGRMFVQLKPRKERQLHVTQIIERLRPRTAGLTGVRVFLSAPSAIRIGGRVTRSQYQFTLQGPDTDALYEQAQRFEGEMAHLPSITDVSSDLALKNPRINVAIDRDKAAALQLNVAEIENSLYSAYGPRWVSTIYAPTAQYRVLLELLPEYQAHPDLLSLLHIRSFEDHLIPLEAFATLRTDAGPLSVNHSGQLPSVTMSFNLKPGVPLGVAVEEINELSLRSLPATIGTSFQGTAKLFQDSLRNLSVLLLVAMGVVYIVLGILYESYVHPLTILSGLPSAGLGALLTLLLFKTDLNMYGFVGLMMLIGIVKKNAIMQIDFALDAERLHGKSPAMAIYEGCLARFRPIMMTTMAALLGTLPIALGYGAGGEARQPLGLTVVGGLLTSQLVTLYLTPVVYTYMAGLMNRLQGGRKLKVALVPAQD
jgi:hydrophobic/amphiphilic exporter-1 (mainly G- bacteria), HAE1 family